MTEDTCLVLETPPITRKTHDGTTMAGNYSCTDPVRNDEGNWTMTKQ